MLEELHLDLIYVSKSESVQRVSLRDRYTLWDRDITCQIQSPKSLVYKDDGSYSLSQWMFN